MDNLPPPVFDTLLLLALICFLANVLTANGEPLHQAEAGSRRRMLQPIEPVNGRFTSITMRLDLCGAEPVWSHQEVYSTILGGGRSLRNYYQQCSFGKLQVMPDDNQNYVVPQPIPVTRACGQLSCGGSRMLDGLNAVAEEAESYASKQLGIDMTQYSVKILLLPPGAPGCDQVRLGYIGCFESNPGPGTPDRRCRTWLSALDVQAVAHETGHNIGLGHAGTKSNANYGDGLCPMGSSAGFYCPNAFHAYKLGWSSFLQRLSADEVQADSWQELELPPRAERPENFVLLSDGQEKDDLFISFLAPSGWERNEDGNSKVLVHTQSDSDNQKSVSLAQLDEGEQMDTPCPGWVVRVSEMSGNRATVQVCYARTASDCSKPRQQAPKLSVFEIPGDSSGADQADERNQAFTASVSSESEAPSIQESSRSKGRKSKRYVHKCADKPRCGDKRCDAWAGENCRTCPSDCARAIHPKTKRPFCCGGRVPLAGKGSSQAAGQGCSIAGSSSLCEPRGLSCAMRCRQAAGGRR